MSEVNRENDAQPGLVDAWRSLSLMVLQHGQQNCDLTVRTMRDITFENMDERRTEVFNDALAALREQLEEQHQKIQTVISGLKMDS